VTQTEERPGEVTEALQKPLPRTNAESTAKQYTFAELLTLLGHVTNDRRDKLSVCWERPGGNFTSQLQTPEDAPRFVDQLVDANRAVVNVWFGVNPLSSEVTKGRGTAKDVTRLTSLWADLDVADGKCPDLDAAHAIITNVSSMLGERPCAVTYSGHGLQPLWKVDQESAEKLSNGDAAQLVKRFGNLVHAAAAEQGNNVDSVFELARVLRVPGTVNVKNPDEPVAVLCETDTGKPLTVEQVRQVLDELGIDERRSRPGVRGTGEGRSRSGAKAVDVGRRRAGVQYQTRQQRSSRDALVNRVATALEGRRNTTLFGATKDAARQGDLDDAMFVALVDAGHACGLDDDEIINTIESAAKVAGTDISTSPSAHVDEAEKEAEFWEQREILSHVCRFARSRGAAPYAVLGSVLRRAITMVDPIVQLPPTVGASASVNLFVVAVGRSGQGKDIANGVGRDAVVFVTADGEAIADPPAVGIGSGEGLARIFKGYGSDDPLSSRHNLEVPEIGTLAALADRKGATLVGELLKGWMGQSLGFTNAQKATTTFVAAHTYRLCLSVGAQPENAEFFLSREKDGLPQRFLWLPTTDPYAPEPSSQSPLPVPRARVVLPVFSPILEGVPYFIGEPDHVQQVLREHRHLVLTGSDDVDPLDGHLMLTRLKVSFGLALLDGRRDISEDDWRIGGDLILVSNRLRGDMRRVVAERRKRVNSARAHEQADRQAIVVDRLSEQSQQRVSEAIVRKLQRVGQATRRDLRDSVTTAIRTEFNPVFELLLDSGAVVRCEGGDRYELARA
jgi:hypothetical protein